MKKIIFMSALSAIALALPVQAAPQQTAQPSAPTIELKIAQSIGLKKALQIASSEVEGKIVEAETDSFGGARVYEVDVLDGKTVKQVKIDAQTGRIMSVRGKRISSIVSRLAQDSDMKAAQTTNVSLYDYLVAVETKTGGEVSEIGLDSENGRVYIEMTVLTNGTEQDVTVDPLTDSITMGDFD